MNTSPESTLKWCTALILLITVAVVAKQQTGPPRPSQPLKGWPDHPVLELEAEDMTGLESAALLTELEELWRHSELMYNRQKVSDMQLRAYTDAAGRVLDRMSVLQQDLDAAREDR